MQMPFHRCHMLAVRAGLQVVGSQVALLEPRVAFLVQSEHQLAAQFSFALLALERLARPDLPRTLQFLAPVATLGFVDLLQAAMMELAQRGEQPKIE